ncbi:MAG: dTDP-4-dehydrorhamnose reductase [Coriobacteriia bacterium]|nr:dTDP-4-dehydrorhamnose reductase [Coriobacteriia bacterium]
MKNDCKLLIVGAGGMLGTALLRVVAGRGCIARAYTEEQFDITDRSAIRETLAEFAAEAANAAATAVGTTQTGCPGAVINAAAYTDVERAEDDAERAFLVNELAAGRLAEAAQQNGLAFVHVSTDFVFDGAKGAPYVETDETNPLSVYGASKLAGEQAVCSAHPDALIVRTAWTYGRGGTNFPLKILQRARGVIADAADAPTLRVVADEIGSPTYSVDLADGLLDLLSAGATGLYHLAGAGSCSRYELALETLRLAGVPVPDRVMVEPVASASFPTRAARPLTCVLDCGKAAALGVRLPAWQRGLARFLAES